MEEIWKDIEGYEGLYQVSNFGRVKSLPRVIRSGNRYGRHQYGGKLLKQGELNGYKRVALCKNRKIKHVSVHRLVAQAFIPNPENKPEVDHLNTLRCDNWVTNLRWATKSENARNPMSMENKKRGHRPGLKGVFGKDNPNSRPIKGVHRETGEIIYFDSAACAGRAGFNFAHIRQCINGDRRSHKNYLWYEINREHITSVEK